MTVLFILQLSPPGGDKESHFSNFPRWGRLPIVFGGLFSLNINPNSRGHGLIPASPVAVSISRGCNVPWKDQQHHSSIPPELSLLMTHSRRDVFLFLASLSPPRPLVCGPDPPQGCCLFPHGCEFPKEAGVERPLPVPGHGAWWRLSHCPVTDPAAILGAPPHPCSGLWVPAVPFAHSVGEHLVS